MKWLLLLVLFLPQLIFSESATPIALEKIQINLNDQASLLRGAKFFAQNCMVCHTMKYLQHNSLAQQAGVTLDKMPLNIKEWAMGVVPPDLTLEARVRSPDWIYTYLHSFYLDPSRPTKHNNLLYKDVAMMDVLAGLQGEQELIPNNESIRSGFATPHYYSILKLVRSGSMTPEEFDTATMDLVNFLVYASEPHILEREHLGIWVLIFLAIFFVLAYFLKKEYWKDIK